MNWKKATVLFIGIVLVVIGIYDVVAIMQGGTEASISHTVYVWSYKYPAFTFLTGFTMGHLFWQMKRTEASKRITEFVEGKDQVEK